MDEEKEPIEETMKELRMWIVEGHSENWGPVALTESFRCILKILEKLSGVDTEEIEE